VLAAVRDRLITKGSEHDKSGNMQPDGEGPAQVVKQSTSAGFTNALIGPVGLCLAGSALEWVLR
jgi:hypothetical protein